MNKFEESLIRIEALSGVNIKKLQGEHKMVRDSEFRSDIDILRELVNKTIPKKLVKDEVRDDLFYCPTCKSWFMKTGLFMVDKAKICCKCGQLMDWNWYDKS